MGKWRGTAKRPAACKRLEEHDAKRVEVARLRRRFATQLLWGHVGWRSAIKLCLGQHGIVGTSLSGQAKIEQHRAPRRLNKNVARLQVSVKPSRCMHGG